MKVDDAQLDRENFMMFNEEIRKRVTPTTHFLRAFNPQVEAINDFEPIRDSYQQLLPLEHKVAVVPDQ